MQKLHQEIAKNLHNISNELLEHYYGISPDPIKVEEKLLKQEAIWTPKGWRAKNLDLQWLELTRLPTIVMVQMFNCSHNNLKDLKWGPLLSYSYLCDRNQLTSLEGSPKRVDGVFSCGTNQLTSLEQGPDVVIGYYYAANNPLECKACNTKIGGRLIVDYSELTIEIGHVYGSTHLTWGKPIETMVRRY